MAKRNKAKEEVTEVSKPEKVVSNKEENEGGNDAVMQENEKSPEVSSAQDYENNESNEQAVKAEEQVNTAPEKQPEQEQPVEGTVKLHILSDDRLNSLITKANELGITDVIQIISSDKYGQFYMIYRA
jgi:Flp pilus assembly protein TadD